MSIQQRNTASCTFKAGVGRGDITPPVGIRLIGYTVRVGLSKAVLEPLTVTALVLGGKNNTIVILAIDLCVCSVEFTTGLRKRCAHALGIVSANVMVNFSHSHSAPMMPGWMPYDTADQLAMQSEYSEQVLEQCENACRMAASNLRPARIGVGWGECQANINRRQRTNDGEVLLGEDANGICDPSVGVLRVDDMAGQPLAVAFRYSCHTVTLGPLTNVISPDFAGPARKLVESQLGCLSLFLQGCAGNINPITGIGQDSENFEDTQRMGVMLGAEVLKVCSTLRTHRRRKQPKLVRSVAVYWLYEYESIPLGDEGGVFTIEEEKEMPLTTFPALEEIEKEVGEWKKIHHESINMGAGEVETNVSQRFLFGSEQRLAATRNGPNPLLLRFPIHAINFGDMALVGLPFEPMAETGLSIQAGSPFKNTFVLGYTNGVVSYLPTPEVSREGGMEARLGYKGYLLPSEIPGDWEPQIKETVNKLLIKIHEK